MTGPAAEGVRVDWAGLPAPVRAAVEQACGSPVARAVTFALYLASMRAVKSA